MLHKVVNRLLTLSLSFLGLILSGSAMAFAQHDMNSYETLNPGVTTTESTEENETEYNTDQMIITPLNPASESSTKEAVKKNNNTSKAKDDSNKEVKEDKPNYGTGTKESESVLSFNFLYYIIQKFKFTDIQDQ